VTQPPEVSVVIPTRGRWPLLAVTLESALGQEGVDHEVVVVDDGSRDETAARLADLRDQPVRVVTNERPRGVAAARNQALVEAHGEWVAFLDDDDLWAPTKLRAQLTAAEAAGADFAYAAAVVVDERYVPFHAPALPNPTKLADALLTANVVPAGSSNVVARAELLHAVGGLDERFGELDDWDLWLRLAHTGRAAVCPEVLVAYVEHAGNMPTARYTDLMAELDLLTRKHAAAEPPIRVAPDRLDYARWVARGHGRAGRRVAAAHAYAAAAVRHRSPGDAARALRVLAAGQPRRFRRADAVPDPDWLSACRQAATP
jgi:glycosyltransferase involved in cell wall biosynthesis